MVTSLTYKLKFGFEKAALNSPMVGDSLRVMSKELEWSSVPIFYNVCSSKYKVNQIYHRLVA